MGISDLLHDLAALIPRNISSCLFSRRLSGTQSQIRVEEKKQISRPSRESNHDPSDFQPVSCFGSKSYYR